MSRPRVVAAAGPPHRRRVRALAVATLSLIFAWTAIQGAREAYRAAWYWLADPWPKEAPVLWTLSGGHGQSMGALASRLRPCLESNNAILEVSTPVVQPDQGFYLLMWLAYFLPEQLLRLTPETDGGVASEQLADYRLVIGPESGPGTDPPAPDGFRQECRTDNVVLYRSMP